MSPLPSGFLKPELVPPYSHYGGECYVYVHSPRFTSGAACYQPLDG